MFTGRLYPNSNTVELSIVVSQSTQSIALQGTCKSYLPVSVTNFKITAPQNLRYWRKYKTW